MAVIDWWNGPLSLVVIFFALCLLLLTWSIAGVACRACHSSGTFFHCDTHTHAHARTHARTHTHTHTHTHARLRLARPCQNFHAGQTMSVLLSVLLIQRTRKGIASASKHEQEHGASVLECIERPLCVCVCFFGEPFVRKSRPTPKENFTLLSAEH